MTWDNIHNIILIGGKIAQGWGTQFDLKPVFCCNSHISSLIWQLVGYQKKLNGRMRDLLKQNFSKRKKIYTEQIWSRMRTWLVGSCCITQGVQLSALRWPERMGWGRGWEEGSRQRGCKYTYGWLTLLHGRNQHNI